MQEKKTKEKKKEKVKFQHTLTDNMQTNNDLFIFFKGFNLLKWLAEKKCMITHSYGQGTSILGDGLATIDEISVVVDHSVNLVFI